MSYPTVDLSGKVVVVTGANTGIGYETAQALAVMHPLSLPVDRSRGLRRSVHCISMVRGWVGVGVGVWVCGDGVVCVCCQTLIRCTHTHT